MKMKKIAEVVFTQDSRAIVYYIAPFKNITYWPDSL